MCKNLYIILLSCIQISLSFCQSLTQEVISPLGGYHKQINGSLQFNLGEVITEDYHSTYCHVQQGFEQGAYGVLSVKTIVNHIDIEVYPNPTRDFISISIDETKGKRYYADLRDLTGKELYHANLLESSKIDLRMFATGVYILNITNQDNLEIQTFKIIKHE